MKFLASTLTLHEKIAKRLIPLDKCYFASYLIVTKGEKPIYAKIWLE